MKTDLAPLWRFGEWLEKIGKYLFVILVGFTLLASSALFMDTKIWINNVFWASLLCLTSIVIVRISILLYKEYYTNNTEDLLTKDVSFNVHQAEQKTMQLRFGLCGGLIAVCASGLLMRTLTASAHDVVPWFLLVSGAMGALGFVLFARGKWKYRSLVSCMFGFAAILAALVMAYTAPIGVQQVQSLTMDKTSFSEIHLYDLYSLSEFAQLQLSSLNILFFSTIGIMVAYLETQIPKIQKK